MLIPSKQADVFMLHRADSQAFNGSLVRNALTSKPSRRV
jgi:hypothetical protein